MSKLSEQLTAHTQIHGAAKSISPAESHLWAQTRKAFEQVKTILARLEDAASVVSMPTTGGVPVTTVINSTDALPAQTFSYPMVVTASAHLIPNGLNIAFGRKIRIRKVEMHADPGAVASAATTFTLQNKKTSPTSTGTVTFASGANVARASGLGVVIGKDQRLYVKAPAALNNVRNVYIIHVSWEEA